MKTLLSSWYAKALLISLVTVLVCVGLYYIGFSDWSDSFRGQGQGLGMGRGGGKPPGGHSHEPHQATFIGMTVPFIKAILMIGIPMTLGIFIGKGFKKIKKVKA